MLFYSIYPVSKGFEFLFKNFSLGLRESVFLSRTLMKRINFLYQVIIRIYPRISILSESIAVVRAGSMVKLQILSQLKLFPAAVADYSNRKFVFLGQY